jgi:hypothetical protein
VDRWIRAGKGGTKPFPLFKKTGFLNPSGHTVIILDKRGKIFYSTLWLKKPVKRFNLPEGTYILQEGEILKRNRPVKYKLKKLPKPERFINIKTFKILFGDNINKCTINYKNKTITFDRSFLNAPLYVVFFIYWHEMGHLLYATEHKADSYAVNRMLINGYNPSQIGLAPFESLSSKQFERKNKVVNTTIK